MKLHGIQEVVPQILSSIPTGQIGAIPPPAASRGRVEGCRWPARHRLPGRHCGLVHRSHVALGNSMAIGPHGDV